MTKQYVRMRNKAERKNANEKIVRDQEYRNLKRSLKVSKPEIEIDAIPRGVHWIRPKDDSTPTTRLRRVVVIK